MRTRRAFFAASAAVPALALPAMAARARHVEERVARRDFSGLTRDDLPTPSLVLDLDVFERNVRHMSTHCRKSGIGLRAHVKIHKSVDVARHQVRAGAMGVCCATIAECELMAGAGLRGVLNTCNPAGREKIQRAATLAKRHPDILFVADDLGLARQLADASAAEGARMNLLVDVFAGLTRHGCPAGAPALEIGRLIDGSKHLKLRGLMAYSGYASHTQGFAARTARSHADLAGLRETADLFKKNGLETGILSGGSTGTYNIDPGTLTELQAGSYVFMDTGYVKIGGRSNEQSYDDFALSLTVLTTVLSKNHPGLCSIDAGLKAALKPTDQVKGRPDVRIENQGAEYGLLLWKDGDRDFRVGSRVEIYPTHLDSTTHLFDRYYAARGEKIVDAWPIMGRTGPAQR